MSSGVVAKVSGGAAGYKTIALEGSIGSGKSTLLRLATEALGGEGSVEGLVEPVGAWKDVGGHNLLQQFYEDPSRWAYTFQSYAFVSRLMLQAKTPVTAPVRLMERSAFSDKHVFATNAHESGLMSDAEWAVYNEIWDFYTTVTPGRPDAFVYLRTSAQTCFERMKRRARVEEQEVPLEYLEAIHDRHDAWFGIEPSSEYVDLGVQVTEDGIPFIVLEGEVDFEQYEGARRVMIEAIASLVETL